uniref:HMA domain-containing protein n=2 Tax=Cajanus cajan TaxID=3821 RepID=A0A151TND7_CAJCA|nr:hypothetical protein KK1_022207 [Cajanus cajan]
MHCDGCASKTLKRLRAFQGVETVKLESDAGKVTVTGKVDPAKLRDYLAEKTKKKVEILSPQNKKEKEKENKDAKTNNKSEDKTDDKKTKDKEVVTTTVLKVAMHCQGCKDRICRIVYKTKGVQEMNVDEEKETVTVKGTVDIKALAGNLTEKLRREVVVVPPKKGKDGEKEGGENEGSGKKKNKGGSGGGDKNENVEVEGEKIYNRIEHLVPPFGFGYGHGHGHGFGHGYVGGYSYVPVYPEQMHLHLHAPPPQMFSDENPHACSVM